ncbi:MAG: phage terminase large subunit family protein [Planctomycetaceae bacterium]|nr:phage terminase large subunit family protein [Planctomycetaceae bacterium]
MEVIKKVETILIQGGGKLALAMPRGSGKTTMIETAAIWALLYGHCRFILVIGATKTEAKKIIKNVKDAIIGTKALLEDFPEAIYPFKKLNGSALLARGQLYLGELTNIAWQPESITFANIYGSLANGATISAVGINGAIRGQKKDIEGENARPDMILLDDPQTDADARSARRIDKLSETIDSTIEGLVAPGEELAMFMACTVIKDGDLASRYLDRNLYPQWRGLVFKMIETMPERMDLWEKYREIRKNEDGVAATVFYKKNRTEMQKGAKVAWKANYSANTLDALEFAMIKWADNFTGFMSEYQNEPVKEGQGLLCVDANIIRTRINGLPRQIVPRDVSTLTAFIDVHDDILYFCVMGFAPDFTGYVLDYGTYPKQTRKFFRKGDNDLVTLQKAYPSIKTKAAIQQGLVDLLRDLQATQWHIEGDEDGNATLSIIKILVDAGYVPEIVENAIRIVDLPSAQPSKGIGITAKNKPMHQWLKKPGRRFGVYWVEERPSQRLFRMITIDSNYWKGALHEGFAVGAGERGGLTFFGTDHETHRMISEHCNAEVPKFVESGENKKYEWQIIPGRDNHLMDCLVGCMVGASVLGIRQEADEAVVKRERKVVKLAN